jgi:hypothetical protein
MQRRGQAERAHQRHGPGPDYQYGSLQAKAPGRQAVQLVGQGEHLFFTLTRAADAVDFHYAIPDSLQAAASQRRSICTSAAS